MNKLREILAYITLNLALGTTLSASIQKEYDKKSSNFELFVQSRLSSRAISKNSCGDLGKLPAAVTAYILDLATKFACINLLALPYEHAFGVPCGNHCIAVAQPEQVKILSFATRPLSCINNFNDSLISTISPIIVLPGNKIAIGCDDQTIAIWDMDSKSNESIKMPCTGKPRAFALLPNNILASGSHEGTIDIYDLTCGTGVRTLKHRGWVSSIVSLPDNRIAARFNSYIKIWNVITGELLQDTSTPHYDSGGLIKLSDSLLAADTQASIDVFDVNSGEWLSQDQEGPIISQRSLARYSTNKLVFARLYGGIWLWDQDSKTYSWLVASGRVHSVIPLTYEQDGTLCEFIAGHNFAVDNDQGSVIKVYRKELDVSEGYSSSSSSSSSSSDSSSSEIPALPKRRCFSLARTCLVQ